MTSVRCMATLALFMLAVTMIFLADISLVSFSPAGETKRPGIAIAGAVQMASETVALAPGELPGYTGWARPESTLASFFSIVSLPLEWPRVGEEFCVSLWCHRHEDCVKGASLFYLRAYGPSVIAGAVKNEGRGKYTLVFVFPDHGRYTVEAVLTFSNPPAIDMFPLTSEQEEPAYEGYLIPGFPLQVDVQKSQRQTPTSIGYESPLCTSDVLLETSVSIATLKARWKVRSKNSAPGHRSSSSKITQPGYLQNVNSLGVQMEFEYLSGCALLPAAAFTRSAGDRHPFTKCGGKNIHIIFIGDSVMRAQWEMFKTMTDELPNIKSSYVTLYGGYRRVTKLDDNIFQTKLSDIQRRSKNDTKAVLFNSGLHDIHRLCASEWSNDRLEYIDNDLLNSGKFSCIKEYKTVIHDFAAKIKAFHAEFKVFQSTTAGWPKYGNFGFDWPLGGQMMPMATDVIPHFNDIAFGVLQKNFPDINLMDGYWITYSRPDNREVGSVGSKLSHPGLEVLSGMTRIWSMVILERICGYGD